jgi:hypothetical protein
MSVEYSKIVPSAETKGKGAFVRTLVGGTGTGFADDSHVHKDWYQKTQSYDDVMEQIQADIDNREDIMVKTRDISAVITDDNQFAFQVQGRKFVPTDWSLQQFSTRAKTPSVSVMREMRNQPDFDDQDGELMVDFANNYMRRMDQDKEFRLRTYTDGTCRAFLTDKYSPVDNRWYMDVLREFLPDARMSHWKGDEDTIFGNLLLPDSIIDYGQDDDTDYGGMVSIGNCEIGKRRMSQYPSIFRAICMNGCIWGQQEGKKISKVHRGAIDLSDLKTCIAENIEMQLNILPDGIRKFLETRTQKMGTHSAKGVIAAVCNDFRLDKKQSTEVLEQFITHEHEHQNLFGVINAVTRAGQEFTADTWFKMDNVGGDLMNLSASRWDTILRRADTYTDKDYEKVFAVTA